MELSLTTRLQNGTVVVHVEGEIDVHTGPRLREALGGLIAAGHHHLVVDLEAVGFMDSTGLAVLTRTLARLRPHEGSLRVACTQDRILRIFRITGLTGLIPIHPGVAEALTAADRCACGSAAGGRGRDSDVA